MGGDEAEDVPEAGGAAGVGRWQMNAQWPYFESRNQERTVAAIELWAGQGNATMYQEYEFRRVSNKRQPKGVQHRLMALDFVKILLQKLTLMGHLR